VEVFVKDAPQISSSVAKMETAYLPGGSVTIIKIVNTDKTNMIAPLLIVMQASFRVLPTSSTRPVVFQVTIDATKKMTAEMDRMSKTVISDPASLVITSVAMDCAFHPQNVVMAITTVGTNQMRLVAAVWHVIFRNLNVPMVKSALQSFKSVTTGRSARMAQMKRIATSQLAIVVSFVVKTIAVFRLDGVVMVTRIAWMAQTRIIAQQ